MRTIVFTLMLAMPIIVSAQGAVELTPTVGYRWDGELDLDNRDFYEGNMKVEGSASLGLVLDVELGRFFYLEVMGDHQSSELGEGGLFEPDEVKADIDVDYYHVGLGGQWRSGRLRPFFVGSLGIARLSPEVPGLSDETRFSMSLGGGLRVDINDHVGVRVELRGYWTDTSDDDWWDDDWWDENCERHGHCDYDWEGFEDFVQGQMRVGVTFRF